MLEQFHFVYPLWLLALPPLAALVWLLSERSGDNNAWHRVVDPNLLPLLLSSGGGRSSRITLWLLGIGWLIAVLALADPTWEKRPQPLFETQQARVIVLDLSRSMNVGDLKPSRLFQARLKVEDILDRKDEGQTGLVVFAGDAFSVVPLTRDAKTLRAMLRVLEPELMPAQGSRADLGLKRAGELLKQAGAPRGDILLITDGIQSNAAIDQASQLNRQGYRVSVLGVGTPEGAVIPDGKGGTLRDQQGNTVIVRLDEQRLRQLASAGGGRYARLQSSDRDLDQILASPSQPQLGGAVKTDKSDMTRHRWKEQGPLLALLLLPLGALAFRRGWLLGLLLTSILLPLPEPATAAIWEDLWKRQDQQAAEALLQGDAETAARLAREPLRLGSAEYRRNDYQSALQAFEKAQGPEADYNRGNALARLGRYEDAIAAYDKALKQAPGMEDALANREAMEKLLQQQQKKQQQQGNKQDKQEGEKGQQEKQQSGQGQSKDGQQQKNQQNQGQNGQQQNAGQDESGKQKEQQGRGKQAQADQGESGSDQDGATRDKGQPAQETQPGKEDENPFARAAEDLKEQQQGRADKGQDESPQQKQGVAKDDQEQAPGKQEQAAAESDREHGKESQAKPGALASGSAEGQKRPLSSEEQMAAEQWLRRIPDDPGGLLRRKFLYQYQQRQGRSSNDGQRW
jgi:Ca-activated chloride channel family protein